MLHELEEKQVEWFAELLDEALTRTDNVDEAMSAVMLCMCIQPIAAMGMVGDEWHGPKPPGEGWVLKGKGPLGGSIWVHGSGTPPAQPKRNRPVSEYREPLQQSKDNRKLAGAYNKRLEHLYQAMKAGQVTPEQVKTQAMAMYTQFTEEAGNIAEHYWNAMRKELAPFRHDIEVDRDMRVARNRVMSDLQQAWDEAYDHVNNIIAGKEKDDRNQGAWAVNNSLNYLEARLLDIRTKIINYIREKKIQPIKGQAFSHDIFNPRAQSILNKSVASSKALTTQGRDALKAALAIEDQAAMAEAIIVFVRDYRVQLGRLLTATQIAALLQGAEEVVKNLPPVPPAGIGVPIPPTLEPHQASAIVESLRGLTQAEQFAKLQTRTPDEQAYLRIAIAAQEAMVPRWSVSNDEFPVINEASRTLAERNVMTREEYDRLEASARAKAFTVAGVDAEQTLMKIRDSLAESAQEGLDRETFRKKVLEAVDDGTFLSDSHLDVVFRTNIQTALSDGQMTVLNHPVIRSGFPYVFYSAIHDDRVRHNHLALEKHGIQGTNIYRINDPVFRMFRPPWDYNDRCGWTPMTIRFAAERGIREAQQWLETGIEPSPPAFVTPPPFLPPPEFRRSLSAAPLSIQIVAMSLESFFA